MLKTQYVPGMDGKWQRWPSWYDLWASPRSAPHFCQTPQRSYQLHLRNTRWSILNAYLQMTYSLSKVTQKFKDGVQHWLKSMYLWELCLCLWDTDPEPEYQGHWHYEDPEGNSESACLLYAEEVNQNSFSLLIKGGKTAKTNLHLQHVRPLGGICPDPRL